MKSLSLREYETQTVELTATELHDLQRPRAGLTIQPAVDSPGRYRITTGSTVGAIQVRNLSVHIRPKVPLDRLLFMVSYALARTEWPAEMFDFQEDTSLFEAVAMGFGQALERTLRRGLLQGYRSVEEAIMTVRGRIRIDDQVRRRFGRMPPVEVVYDDFTTDIEENRLLLAAVRLLGGHSIRSNITRKKPKRAAWMLSQVTRVEYHPGSLPDVRYTRLNEPYRAVIRRPADCPSRPS